MIRQTIATWINTPIAESEFANLVFHVNKIIGPLKKDHHAELIKFSDSGFLMIGTPITDKYYKEFQENLAKTA